MIRHFIFCCVLMSFTTSNIYFDYYELINQATYAGYQKEHSKADALFQKAFETIETPFITDYNPAINNALELKDFDKTFSYLKTAIQLGFSKEKIEEKAWFRQIENRTEWFLLEQEYPALREKYEAQFDEELRQEIMEICNSDQALIVSFGNDENSKEIKKLKEIIKKHGYPGYHQVGQDINFDWVLHHFTPEINEKYFYEPMKAAIFTGDISPFRYAAAIDYDAIKKGNGTVYGTYFATVDGVRYLQPVENFDDVNKRRKSIGLEPIEQSLEKHNIIYDPNFIGF